ncbi:MAG TPA: hypothetical protein VF145_09715, partial [Chitinophagaceae bacterium]
MKQRSLIAVLLTAPLLFSCVSSKKFKSVLNDYDTLRVQYLHLQSNLMDCNRDKNNLAAELSASRTENNNMQKRVEDLNKQIDYLKENNTTVLKQMQDLSVVSASQAESIRKSLESLGAKDAYIQDLQTALARKDSMNMALVINL